MKKSSRFISLFLLTVTVLVCLAIAPIGGWAAGDVDCSFDPESRYSIGEKIEFSGKITSDSTIKKITVAIYDKDNNNNGGHYYTNQSVNSKTFSLGNLSDFTAGDSFKTVNSGVTVDTSNFDGITIVIYVVTEASVNALTFEYDIRFDSDDSEDVKISNDYLSFTADGGNNIFRIYASSTYNIVKSAPWITLSATAGSSDKTISVSCDKNTSTSSRSGTIIITSKSGTRLEIDVFQAAGSVETVAGDINGDGALNNKDVSRFTQYIAGWDVEVNSELLDTNGDGAVNNKDVSRLMKYIAGWDVELFGGSVACKHEPVTDATVAATCTESGLTEGSHCGLCGEVIVAQKAVAATGHTRRNISAIAPTCTTAGSTAGADCSVCGAVISAVQSVPATGHSYVNGVCSVCGYRDVTSVGEGNCGDTLTWTLDGNGLLSISGSGEMNEYSNSDQPWYSLRSSIYKIVLAEGVTNIGKNAFRNCENLVSVTIPDSVKTIDEDAFYSCDSLRSVIFGNGVKSIGKSAFNRCISMEAIDIPDSVTVIDSYAFQKCTNLSSVVIGANVDSIERYAFSYCTKLSSVTMGEKVTYIGERAFMDCSSLKSMVIPESVLDIEIYAFNGCTSLTSVVFEKTDDWIIVKSDGTRVMMTDLDDAVLSAQYLTDKYDNLYWYQK